MTEQELHQYIGERVEVRFTSNETLVGKLVTGGEFEMLEPRPYALEIPPANINEQITWLPIPDASVIESIRIIERR
jgi:hypothetical protein